MTDPYKCGRCGLPVSPGVCAPQPHVFHDRPEQCVPDLVAEVARLRTMFDVTRHRVCDALRVDRGRSWSSIEGIVADVMAVRERDGNEEAMTDLPAYVAELREALMAARRVVNPVTNENTSRMIDEALGLPVPEPLRPSK